MDSFDLVNQQGDRVAKLTVDTLVEIPEYQLIANGDVDFSGEFVTPVEIV